MNINPEAYKYTRSAAPSRSKWRLIDIFPINYIIYTHNFHTESQESLLFNHMPSVKIRLDIPKLWQVEHELNNKTGVHFLTNVCRFCVVELDITLKPLNRFLYAAYHLKE